MATNSIFLLPTPFRGFVKGTVAKNEFKDSKELFEEFGIAKGTPPFSVCTKGPKKNLHIVK